MTDWDVAVIGAGPAGLSAGHAAALAGARTLVLERAAHPRYKTCGGGLIGVSLASLAGRIEIPADDRVTRVRFTRDGRFGFTRTARTGPLLTMVRRERFDDRLRRAAEAVGAQVRQRVAVRAIEQDPDGVRLRLVDGTELRARVAIGADGSAGISAGHVGVRYDQVDLGLELEFPVPTGLAGRWRGRVLLDWGPLPGSYGWVFPKEDRLTVGVIAGRGHGEQTRAYLRRFVARLGLADLPVAHDSGHLTRCRTDGSPLRHGRVIITGDAAGLLDPWTREGISFALRSGALAGEAAALGDLESYPRQVSTQLAPSMRAGRQLLAAFRANPGAFHAAVATPPGWRLFTRFCRGQLSLDQLIDRRPVRAVLAILGAGDGAGAAAGHQPVTGR